MRFISLDIETTGLNPEQDQVLEVGAIAVDTKTKPSSWPTFHVVINHKRIHGDIYAINLNARLFEILKDYQSDPKDTKIPVIQPEEFLDKFLMFVKNAGWKEKNGHFTVTLAGKNVMNFDVPFLQEHMNKYCYTNFTKIADTDTGDPIRFRKRAIDPALLYVNFLTDENLPAMIDCKKRAFLPEVVTHNALEDAWDVVYLILAKIGFDFTQTISDDQLTDLFIKMERRQFTYILWSLKNGYIIRKMKTPPTDDNIFNRYEIGEPISDTFEPIWSMNEVYNYVKVEHIA